MWRWRQFYRGGCAKRVERVLLWLFGCVMVSFGFSLIVLIAFAYYFLVMPHAGHSLMRDVIETGITLALLAHILLSYYLAVKIHPGSPPKPEDVAKAIEAGTFSELFPDLHPPFNICKKCQRIRTERTHHCSVCRVCVLKMDHHCPWLAQCVGQNNYRHFVQLLFWLTVGSVYGSVLLGPTAVAHIMSPKLDREWQGSLISLQVVLFAGLLCIAVSRRLLISVTDWLCCRGAGTLPLLAHSKRINDDRI